MSPYCNASGSGRDAIAHVDPTGAKLSTGA
jgi:hypothetical protein